MYDIFFSDKAVKQLEKLSKDVQMRMRACLERCRIRPYVHIKRLVGIPYFSLRVGDYRVIIDVQDQQLRILVIEIGHRKNVYK
ncbi:MAG: type II toxin-antitoxin system RelE/ParE family toxin [Nanoarchaeota archaeon]|nr:type II toxin-antitoxin system RelE/ParE family toxin [Nanoarchaeota archaeon]